ncbi:endopeptidase [uncultured Brevibacillus sp.]|uniref:glycoside hydrolase family 19 protein n=1 Tax=uncultured Brevibacillus sp. TaxID=169970 RepID=UPI00259435E9|nr:endopeptidase [uncultured Brevibacillus sp.]
MIIDPSAVKANFSTSYKGKIYVTSDQLTQIGFKNVNDHMVNGLNNTLNKFEITTPDRIRHFLAQVMVESDLGRATVEYGPESYFSKYDGRNGNIQPGDGAKYRGAGYIQLTGKSNYQKFADFMGGQKIIQEGYSYVAENYAWESAGYFWKNNKFNDLVDKGSTVKQITRRVNGGYNHLKEREKYYQAILDIIK